LGEKKIKKNRDCLDKDLFLYEPVGGTCRVICYSPAHNLTFAEMTVPEILKIIQTWIKEYYDLRKMDQLHYVQIFENKGAMMGCSNPHPHGQVYDNLFLNN